MNFNEENFAKKITSALDSKDIDDKISKKLEIARNNALLAYENKHKNVNKNGNTIVLSDVFLKVSLPIVFLIAFLISMINMNHQFSLDTSVVDVQHVLGLDDDDDDDVPVDFGVENIFTKE